MNFNESIKELLIVGIEFGLKLESFTWMWIGVLVSVSCAFVFKSYKEESQLRFKMWLSTLIIALLIWPGLYFILPSMIFDIYQQTYSFPLEHLYFNLYGLIAGAFLVLIWWRFLEPNLINWLQILTRQSKSERTHRTDVRDISKYLPSTKKTYDPRKYFKKDSIFVGRDEKNKPAYIEQELWRKSHVDIIGTTGGGKGLAACSMLSQALIQGESVFVFDPKNDEWAPHVLRDAAEKANVPFYLLNLNPDNDSQINLLDGISIRECEEMLIAGFGLSEKGQEADFYRIADRRLARSAAAYASVRDPSYTFLSLYSELSSDGALDDVENFAGHLGELASLPPLNAAPGLSLEDVMNSGGCVYVVGSMRNESVIKAQRMLLIRLIQYAERRDRLNELRPVAIFLDEVKYHLSKPTLEALGTARDKGVHLIMAHQSLSDLKDCPSDLNPDSVVGAIVENTRIKLAYRVQNPDTAEWLSAMSGTILVDDEIRKVERNPALAETIESNKTLRQAERNYIDTNMLLNLPAGCAVLYGNGLPKFIFVSPIPVGKSYLEIFSEPFSPVNKQNDNLTDQPMFSPEDLINVD